MTDTILGTDHHAAGDLMQSSLSRMIEWMEPIMRSEQAIVPYEVRMAVLEGKSAVQAWTDARRTDAHTGRS